MALLVTQAKGAAATGKTDLNRVTETVLVPLFREVFGYTQLRNLNATERHNYPAIDLADDAARVCFQVTATAEAEKVKETLKTFVRHRLYERYDRLFIYIITEKQRSYSGSGYEEIIGGTFAFDKEADILDFRDVLQQVETLQIDRARRVENILEANLGSTSVPLFGLDQPDRTETVFLNLLEFRFPAILYTAAVCLDMESEGEGSHNRRRRAWDRSPKDRGSARDRIRAALQQQGLRFAADWEYHARQIITFHDLRDDDIALAKVIDRGTVDRLTPAEFYSIDEDHEKVFKSLLRRCLQQKLYHQGVTWQHEEGLFIFSEANGDSKRVERWRTSRANQREVYVRTMKKNKPDEILKCKHLAFEVQFRRFGDNWYLVILPDWFFSYDGFHKSRFCAADLKWLKRNENNGHVANHIEFIAYFLKRHRASDLFEEQQPYQFLSFGEFASFNNAPFLDDSTWRPAKDDEGGDQLSVDL
jgi:hypothetical protein